ncbi:MAG: hypothetical protein MJA82_04355 [Clostridia bacterium]|nr:hypothetical protein [Clostridia bacterium]
MDKRLVKLLVIWICTFGISFGIGQLDNTMVKGRNGLRQDNFPKLKLSNGVSLSLITLSSVKRTLSERIIVKYILSLIKARITF